MRALPARGPRDVAAEQPDRSAVGRKLAGDEIEQRRLAGAIWTDDQPPLAGLHGKRDIAADAQAAERLAKRIDHKSRHELRPPSERDGARLDLARTTFQPARHSRTEPGTRPSGRKVMMMTKMTPRTRFQRTT